MLSFIAISFAMPAAGADDTDIVKQP